LTDNNICGDASSCNSKYTQNCLDDSTSPPSHHIPDCVEIKEVEKICEGHDEFCDEVGHQHQFTRKDHENVSNY